MKAGSISEIKKELLELDNRALVELCLNLAKYKKDNKEYLAYLLFEAHDKSAFVVVLKEQIEMQF